MKRAKATEKEKNQIKVWLHPFLINKIKKQLCPFATILTMCPLEKQPYCRKFFPKLKDHCPCKQFPFGYVQKIARELIE